ncbi:hypothetical protein REPUB_Repub17cG0081300 [Reevesia pubescens]
MYTESKFIIVEIWDRLIDEVWGTLPWQLRSHKAKENSKTQKERSIMKNTWGQFLFQFMPTRW